MASLYEITAFAGIDHGYEDVVRELLEKSGKYKVKKGLFDNVTVNGDVKEIAEYVKSVFDYKTMEEELEAARTKEKKRLEEEERQRQKDRAEARDLRAFRESRREMATLREIVAYAGLNPDDPSDNQKVIDILEDDEDYTLYNKESFDTLMVAGNAKEIAKYVEMICEYGSAEAYIEAKHKQLQEEIEKINKVMIFSGNAVPGYKIESYGGLITKGLTRDIIDTKTYYLINEQPTENSPFNYLAQDAVWALKKEALLNNCNAVIGFDIDYVSIPRMLLINDQFTSSYCVTYFVSASGTAVNLIKE